MLKKEQEKTLVGLEQLYAKGPMMAKRSVPMWAVVLLTAIVIVFGVHALKLSDKILKCEQMQSLEIKMALSPYASLASYDSEDSRLVRKFENECQIPGYGKPPSRAELNDD
jgi:hypothetical protein